VPLAWHSAYGVTSGSSQGDYGFWVFILPPDSVVPHGRDSASGATSGSSHFMGLGTMIRRSIPVLVIRVARLRSTRATIMRAGTETRPYNPICHIPHLIPHIPCVKGSYLVGMARHAPTWMQDSYHMIDILSASHFLIPNSQFPNSKSHISHHLSPVLRLASVV
jgi:hypothetical protein